MTQQPDQQADRRLLEAIQAFVAGHPDPAVQRFQDSITNWGDHWTAVTPRTLPATDTLSTTLSLTIEQTHALTSCFDREKHHCRWEQSYTSADGVVGDDMLTGYGFAEVIGKLGPFVSTRVRAGIGVWGPNIVYPPHRHRAEEIYVVLAGSARFRLGDGTAAIDTTCGAGEVVYVPSMQTHGFWTEDSPLAVFYIWQAGDLREKSAFD